MEDNGYEMPDDKFENGFEMPDDKFDYGYEVPADNEVHEVLNGVHYVIINGVRYRKHATVDWRWTRSPWPDHSAVTTQEKDTGIHKVVDESDMVRHTDRIRAFVNITYVDPITGERKSERYFKGKWGTTGIMKAVMANAFIPKYGDGKRDGCHQFKQPLPSGPWIALIERGQCRFSEKIRNAVAANATAVIVFDNEPHKTPPFMHHDVSDAVAIFIDREMGLRIVDLLEAGVQVKTSIKAGVEKANYTPNRNNVFSKIYRFLRDLFP